MARMVSWSAPAAESGHIAVDPRRVTTEHHREAGPVHVGYQFWERLGLHNILREIGIGEAHRPEDSEKR